MTISLRQNVSHSSLCVVNPRLHGSEWHLEQRRHFIERQIFEEIKRKRLALQERKLIQRTVNRLGVIESVNVICRLIGHLVRITFNLLELPLPQAADRRVPGGTIQERGKRP